MPSPTDNHYFAWIDEESPEIFAKHLLDHIRQGTDSWTPLLAASRIERVWLAIGDAKRNVEFELVELGMARAQMQQTCYRKGHFGKQDWFDYEVEYKRLRLGLTQELARFAAALSKVKPSYNAAKLARGSENDNFKRELQEETARVRQVTEALIRAITEHQSSIEYSGNNPTPSDRALWSQLARLKFPTRTGEISLREWLARMDSSTRV